MKQVETSIYIYIPMGEGVLDHGHLNAFLAAALLHVVCAAVPVHADSAASVLHSAACLFVCLVE